MFFTFKTQSRTFGGAKMLKSYKLLVILTLIALMAGSAMAADKDLKLNGYTLTHLDAADSPSGRAVYILAFDFAEVNVDYIAAGVVFGSEGILPDGATMVGFGFTDVVAEVYENEGAAYSNWASEAWLGCTYEDAVEGLSFVGVSPFAENEGPGTFGPATNYFALNPADWPLPAADPFTFYAETAWDDATGLASGTFTSGIVYAEIESPVVANEPVSLSAVKAMYR